MEYGFLSLLPPVIAITCAIITKDALLSLFIGVSVGGFILANFHPLLAMQKIFEIIGEVLGDPEWNLKVILVVLLLGGLIGLLQKSGASLAFAEWVSKKVKSRTAAQGVCWVMGLFIFFDDYFNSLTIGAVMRPVTDRFKVSREKLAYILDSTAAPVCIMAPVSSWVAYVISLIAPALIVANITEQPFVIFLKTIPYNFYAWAAILMVIMVIFTKLEYGPMAKSEKRALLTGKTFDDSRPSQFNDDFKNMVCSNKGKVSDMLLPVLTLFLASFVFMLYTGGYFEGGITVGQAFYETDSCASLIYGIFLAILLAMIMYHIRGTVKIFESMEALVTGMKSMFIALCFLTLAWSIGFICESLDAGGYLCSLVGDIVPGSLIPFLIFLVSCFTAFSTGASWGTYAIMMPIAIPLAVVTQADLTISIAAVLSGGVFGDHCSPLADTTILSSAGAAVNHLDHVNTQLPYACTAGVSAAFGFMIAGFTNGPVIPFLATLIVFIFAVIILNKFFGLQKNDHDLETRNNDNTTNSNTVIVK